MNFSSWILFIHSFFFFYTLNISFQFSCFRCLFDCLSAENLIFVVSAVLLEQRVLLHSENLDTLNKCAEALIALLFPLCWQHVYVPLLPTQLLEYLSAPVCCNVFFEIFCFSFRASENY